MTGRARLIRRRINTQRRIRLSKNLLKTVRERPPLLIRELTLKTGLHRISRLRQNLVINISDIADRRHLQTAVTHPTAQLVKNQRRTDVAQVRFTLHRSTAIVDTRLTGHDGLKLANSRGSRIIKTHSHTLILRGRLRRRGGKSAIGYRMARSSQTPTNAGTPAPSQ